MRVDDMAGNVCLALVAGFPRLAWECHRALAAAASVRRCKLSR